MPPPPNFSFPLGLESDWPGLGPLNPEEKTGGPRSPGRARPHRTVSLLAPPAPAGHPILGRRPSSSSAQFATLRNLHGAGAEGPVRPTEGDTARKPASTQTIGSDARAQALRPASPHRYPCTRTRSHTCVHTSHTHTPHTHSHSHTPHAIPRSSRRSGLVRPSGARSRFVV